jgi:hypothetical protein
MYYRARYYQADLGRFASVDSVRGALENPGTQHSYSYATNNPINAVDPSGNITLRLAGLILALTGLKMVYNFFSFFWPEMQALAQKIREGWSFWQVLAYWLFFWSIENVYIVWGVMYMIMGWQLMRGPTAALGMPLMRFAKQVANFVILVKATWFGPLWSVSIAAGCVSVLSPLLLSQPFSASSWALSASMCILGSVGILTARRVAGP